MESAVVAFSGGVDSALLVVLAHAELGNRMVAVMGVSASVPERDRLLATSFCTSRKIPFVEMDTKEFEDPRYLKNPANRCFFCKQTLFRTLLSFADENNFQYILEGTNASDLKGHRPGYAAKEESDRILSPLVDAGFTKDDVRQLARDLTLEVAEKPQSACLSSRIEIHLPIDPGVLKKIDSAENTLRDLGLQQVRVRFHRDHVRIEVGTQEIEQAFSKRHIILEKLTALGWNNISLDLAGYASKK
ncbi:MAG: ATP-dependent sacrificial sulfur transferase LarE [Deltaproteobacteria bacterium]|nr:ATP-dependent sacrificial sulfur transferase LarE [Deltaproteobacteria bacterium]